VGKVRLFAGVTPVSVGGDSIGATIQVESAPEFAAAGQGKLLKGEAGALPQQRRRRGAHLSPPGHRTDEPALRRLHRQGRQLQGRRRFKPAGAAASDKPTRWLPATRWARAATRRQPRPDLRLRSNTTWWSCAWAAGHPYQNYPNQRMDMTRNDSHQFNLRYQGQYAWGQLQARATTRRPATA
jgi:iron complex outermembrane receptor protein